MELGKCATGGVFHANFACLHGRLEFRQVLEFRAVRSAPPEWGIERNAVTHRL